MGALVKISGLTTSTVMSLASTSAKSLFGPARSLRSLTNASGLRLIESSAIDPRSKAESDSVSPVNHVMYQQIRKTESAQDIISSYCQNVKLTRRRAILSGNHNRKLKSACWKLTMANRIFRNVTGVQQKVTTL